MAKNPNTPSEQPKIVADVRMTPTTSMCPETKKVIDELLQSYGVTAEQETSEEKPEAQDHGGLKVTH